jgi:GNAT superfamily N-acetyltransferase
MQTTEELNGYVIRPPVADDIPGIIALINAHSQVVEGVDETNPEDYAQMWQRPGYDGAADSRIAVAPNGAIVGVVHAFSYAPHVRNWQWTRIHPAHWGRGLGSHLTVWGEARIAEHFPAAPESARVTVTTGIPTTHQPGTAVLTGLGYHAIRGSYIMAIDLDTAPPTPAWPEGITLRSMEVGQEEAVFRAMREAFRDHWGHVEGPFAEEFQRWDYWVKHRADFDPTLFFVAWAGGEIAGTALCFPKDDEFPDMGWVDDLAVRRPWRRQGLGLALLHHAFGEFYRRGIRKAGLGVDASSLTGATRLYERAGMRIFRQFDVYEKELRPGADITTQTLAE